MEMMMYTTCRPQSANKPLCQKTTTYRTLFAIPMGQFQMFCLTCRPTHTAPVMNPHISSQFIFDPMIRSVRYKIADCSNEQGWLVNKCHMSAIRKNHQL